MTYRKITTAAVLILSLLYPAPAAFAGYRESDAGNYLKTHSGNPWSTIALAALNELSIPTDHLVNIEARSAIEYAAPILAISALQKNPRDFGGEDYVTSLKNYYANGQIGDASTLNDDFFGLLALASADEPNTNPVISASRNFVAAHQNSDGGWGFTITSGSDTNMTAAAVLALLGTGTDEQAGIIQKGVTYLRNAQNSDGGFPYDPESSFGTQSDSSSTAWVVWALNALHINPANWTKSAGNPISYLESNQAPEGFFRYQQGSAEDSFSPITTAYVVIALTGRALPLGETTPAIPEIQKFPFRIEGPAVAICSGETDGPSAMDIVVNSSNMCGFSYLVEQTSFGPYLKKINEFEAGGMTGWLFLINNIAPSVGAADYLLKDGDAVVWYYGEFDKPPAFGEVGLKVAVRAGQVGGATTTPADTISFTVEPSEIDFGTLDPGSSAAKNVEVTNTGSTDLQIETLVNGDSLFLENLRINNSPWRSFSAGVAGGAKQNYAVGLNIPSNYSASGSKQGQLTFWAQAE